MTNHHENTENTDNLMTDDEVIDTAYDIFLELALDNLDQTDAILFNLQFEEIGAAELYVPEPLFWQDHVTEIDLDNDEEFAEVVIGLTGESEQINDIFARILLSRDKSNKLCHILWKE
ncbi:HI1450 family dsDNA-mimic protein [Utexia brackfieldae]|uniref:HI1450 family dsDNA-mimic protein n=1 Tax=Utexia brackfieldae TaxID=3074108 RepID=UPI00370D539A